MALQTSGAISLNDIHVEAGGTSGTTCSINDSDIRALIGKASGATMSFSEWYGASNLVFQGTLVPGNYAPSIYSPERWGYTLGYGSWTETTDNIGYTVSEIYAQGTYGSTSASSFFFIVSGNESNSGWTTLQVQNTSGTNLYSINRTSMNYAYNSTSNRTQWSVSTTSTYGGIWDSTATKIIKLV